jgi:putative autoinducer-2 (AI-2) aldolase
MARIFRGEKRRTIMLALDHGMALGPMRGIERPRELLASIGAEVDSIMLNKGLLVRCAPPDLGAGIVLRVSGASTIAGPDLTAERLTTTMEEAQRLSADAVATSIFVGTPNEHSSIQSLALLADECHRYGMPLLAVTALGKDREHGFDPRYLSLAVRVAAEMGADIIKTYYCAEGFERVIEAAAGVPVVIAGGPQMESDLLVLQTAWKAISAGAAGVDMGRNVWQNAAPAAMLRALRSVIHGGASAEDASATLGT